MRRKPRTAGVGLRLPHLAEVAATRPTAAWFEIHPENFLANPHARELLQDIARGYPISVHTVGVSIGSAGGIDPAHHKRVRTRYFAATRSWLESFPLAVIQLAMRIAVGAVFFNSGLLKIRSWEFAIKLFEDEYKVPLLDPILAARLAAFNEIAFPHFLFLGLATRLATLPLLGMVLVIQVFVYPQAWTEHLLWASALTFLLTRGPGALSLDHLIESHLMRR